LNDYKYLHTFQWFHQRLCADTKHNPWHKASKGSREQIEMDHQITYQLAEWLKKDSAVIVFRVGTGKYWDEMFDRERNNCLDQIEASMSQNLDKSEDLEPQSHPLTGSSLGRKLSIKIMKKLRRKSPNKSDGTHQPQNSPNQSQSHNVCLSHGQNQGPIPKQLNNTEQQKTCQRRGKIRYNGVVDYEEVIDGTRFRLVDMVNATTNPRKWIRMFDCAHMILFYAEIHSYDKSSQKTGNSMLLDSIEQFNHVIEIFPHIPVTLLFFNKDILRERISNNVSFQRYVPSYQGRNRFEEISRYIQISFLAKNRNFERRIYSHFTDHGNEEECKRFLYNSVRATVHSEILEDLKHIFY